MAGPLMVFMISEKGDKKVSGSTSLKKLDQCWYFLGGKGEKMDNPFLFAKTKGFMATSPPAGTSRST
jgi:hypothetical protein